MTRDWDNPRPRRQQRRGIWCPRHPEAKLQGRELANGKIDLRCPECAPRRCETNAVDLRGSCMHCGAWQGEACLAPKPATLPQETKP